MMYWRRPLTRLEAGLYAGLVGIAITFFAREMLGYMEIAERSAMQATLINTTSAINVRLAQRLANSREDPEWRRRNPFELAGTPPPNYSREAGLDKLQSGQWSFDATRMELVYLPRLRFSLHIPGGSDVLRFRLVRGPAGYFLEPSTPFEWQ